MSVLLLGDAALWIWAVGNVSEKRAVSIFRQRGEMVIDIWYLFIYCNWVSTRWQWSVDLYKNMKDAAQKEKNTQNNTKNRTHKIENKNTKLQEKKNIET